MNVDGNTTRKEVVRRGREREEGIDNTPTEKYE